MDIFFSQCLRLFPVYQVDMTFEWNVSTQCVYASLYCSPVQHQIFHMDAGRVAGSLQTYPEGNHNDQTYDLSQKGKSLQ